jgi:hypothetical protein
MTVMENLSESLNSIFVKGLGKNVDGPHLQIIFSKFGIVVDAQIAKHRSGRSAGFAIVTFSRHEEAMLAMKHMDNSMYQGRKLSLRWFEPDSEADQASLQSITMKGLTRLGPPQPCPKPRTASPVQGGLYGNLPIPCATSEGREAGKSLWSFGWMDGFSQVSGKNDQDASWAVHSEGSDDSFNSAPVAAVDIWGPPQDITADIKSRISTYLPESLSLHDDDTRDLMTPRDVSSIPPFDFSNGVTTSDSASSSFDFGINTLDPIVDLQNPGGPDSSSTAAEFLLAHNLATSLSSYGQEDLSSALLRLQASSPERFQEQPWGVVNGPRRSSGSSASYIPDISGAPTTSNSNNVPSASSASLLHAVLMNQAAQLNAAQQQYAAALAQLAYTHSQMFSAPNVMPHSGLPEFDFGSLLHPPMGPMPIGGASTPASLGTPDLASLLGQICLY